jgi:hypothetical protein
MDVTFREHESYYGEKPDLTNVFPNFSTNDNLDTCRVEQGDKIEGPDGPLSCFFISSLFSSKNMNGRKKRRSIVPEGP